MQGLYSDLQGQDVDDGGLDHDDGIMVERANWPNDVVYHTSTLLEVKI
jgi:hypothetical protein